MNNTVFDNKSKYTLDYLVRFKSHFRKKLEAKGYLPVSIEKVLILYAGLPLDKQIQALRNVLKHVYKGHRKYGKKIHNLLNHCDFMTERLGLPYVIAPSLYSNTDKQIVEFLHNSLNDLNKKWAEKCRTEKKTKEKEELEKKKAEALAKAPSTSSWTRTGPSTFARDFSPIQGWVVKQVSERTFNVHHPHGVYNVKAPSQSWALLVAMHKHIDTREREISILRERSADLHKTIADLTSTLDKKNKDIAFLKEWVNNNV